jgi:hypothetical protein
LTPPAGVTVTLFEPPESLVICKGLKLLISKAAPRGVKET